MPARRDSVPPRGPGDARGREQIVRGKCGQTQTRFAAACQAKKELATACHERNTPTPLLGHRQHPSDEREGANARGSMPGCSRRATSWCTREMWRTRCIF